MEPAPKARDGLDPIWCISVQRDDRGQRLVRISAAEQHDMDCIGAVAMNCVEFVRAAARYVRVKRGQWCAGGAKGWRRDQQNFSKVGLRRPVNRFLDGAVAWVGREIATPSAGGTTRSPALGHPSLSMLLRSRAGNRHCGASTPTPGRRCRDRRNSRNWSKLATAMGPAPSITSWLTWFMHPGRIRFPVELDQGRPGKSAA